MKPRKILFPTDFSTTSDAALAFATSIAKDRGLELLIVHVEEPPMSYGIGDAYYGVVEPDRHDMERMLKAVVPPDGSVGYEHRLIQGEPSEAITRLAAEEPVEMIVMSTHGRSGLMRFLMGSVAESVVRHATCPVLTFKAQPAPVGSS